MGGSRSGRVRTRAPQLVSTGVPPQPRRNTQPAMMAAMKSDDRMTPGMMPARYSSGTELLVMRP